MHKTEDNSGIANFVKGDTKKYRVQVTRVDPDTGVESPISVDGGTIWMTFKKSQKDADPGALQVSFPCTESDPANPTGNCYIVLTADDTKTLQVGVSYYYDIQFVNADGEVTTILHGDKVKILAETTESV